MPLCSSRFYKWRNLAERRKGALSKFTHLESGRSRLQSWLEARPCPRVPSVPKPDPEAPLPSCPFSGLLAPLLYNAPGLLQRAGPTEALFC